MSDGRANALPCPPLATPMTVSKPSPLAVLVLVDCSQSYIIKIIDSCNVTIANVMLKQCNQLQLTNFLITLCYSCTIENVIFMNLGLDGGNLIGKSHLKKVTMKSNRNVSKFLMICQKIVLTYWPWDLQSFNDHMHYLTINQIDLIGDGTKCHSDGTMGLHIHIVVMEGLLISLTDSLFSNLDHTALTIISQCHGYNKVLIENCTFETNHILSHNFGDFYSPSKPLIDVVVAPDNKSVSFKHCKFTGNHHSNTFMSVIVRAGRRCRVAKKNCERLVTNISFVACQFINNELIKTNAVQCKGNFLIIGPVQIKRTYSGTYVYGAQ